MILKLLEGALGPVRMIKLPSQLTQVDCASGYRHSRKENSTSKRSRYGPPAAILLISTGQALSLTNRVLEVNESWQRVYSRKTMLLSRVHSAIGRYAWLIRATI